MGQTFEDTFEVFGHVNLQRGGSFWKLHKVKSNGFLGLEGVSCEFYGPAYDKPISSISFELKPLKIGLFQKPYSPYMKQLDIHGEKEVWVNCFCATFDDGWKTDIYIVSDGGNCFFDLKINLDAKKYYDFMVNGDA